MFPHFVLLFRSLLCCSILLRVFYRNFSSSLDVFRFLFWIAGVDGALELQNSIFLYTIGSKNICLFRLFKISVMHVFSLFIISLFVLISAGNWFFFGYFVEFIQYFTISAFIFASLFNINKSPASKIYSKLKRMFQK